MGAIDQYDAITDALRIFIGVDVTLMRTIVHFPDDKNNCLVEHLLSRRFGHLDPRQPILPPLLENYHKFTTAFTPPASFLPMAAEPISFVKDDDKYIYWIFNSPVFDRDDFHALGGYRTALKVTQLFNAEVTCDSNAEWFAPLFGGRFGSSGGLPEQTTWLVDYPVATHLQLVRLDNLWAANAQDPMKYKQVQDITLTVDSDMGFRCYFDGFQDEAQGKQFALSIFNDIYAETRDTTSTGVAPEFYLLPIWRFVEKSGDTRFLGRQSTSKRWM